MRCKITVSKGKNDGASIDDIILHLDSPEGKVEAAEYARREQERSAFKIRRALIKSGLTDEDDLENEGYPDVGPPGGEIDPDDFDEGEVAFHHGRGEWVMAEDAPEDKNDVKEHNKQLGYDDIEDAEFDEID